jgi:acyl dehydratase
MSMEHLTGDGNYFEDFIPGDVMQHARGKTVGEIDNVMITNMVMNTASAHFDVVEAQKMGFPERISFGGVNISIVIGLAAQDTTENALEELSMDNIRLKNPVFHGDTLMAYSEVLDVDAGDREDAGIVRFRHWGINQDGKVVMEAERTALIKKRAYWATK